MKLIYSSTAPEVAELFSSIALTETLGLTRGADRGERLQLTCHRPGGRAFVQRHPFARVVKGLQGNHVMGTRLCRRKRRQNKGHVVKRQLWGAEWTSAFLKNKKKKRMKFSKRLCNVSDEHNCCPSYSFPFQRLYLSHSPGATFINSEFFKITCSLVCIKV